MKLREALPPSPPSPRWTLGMVLGAAVVFTWPLVVKPLQLFGHPLGETDNHLWMFWRAVRRLAGAGALANYPEGLPLPLMDPVNLPLALPGYLVHPVLGYNGLMLANVLLGLATAWWLARQHVGPRAAWVCMVTVGCSPFLSGVMEFGITESWPTWPLAAHLAFLWRYSRHGRRRDAIGAGLCLGAFALSGWYNAFFGLIVQIVLLPWLFHRHRRWRGLLGQGMLAGVMTLPSLLYFLSIRELWDGRWHLPTAVPRAHLDHWRWLRNYGTDALNLVLPSVEPAPVSLSVYLGLAVVGLAALGWWARRRQAAPLALLALVFLALALGHWLRVGGEVVTVAGTPLPGPARLLVKLFPPLIGLSHWHRAVGPATVFLGVLAAMGAERLVAGSTPRAVGLVVLVLAESLFLGQTHWPRHHYAVDLPEVYSFLEAPGAIIELPFDNGRRPFSQEPPRVYNRWQTLHGLPVAENYEGLDAVLASNRLVAAADALCGLHPTRPPHELPPKEMTRAEPLDQPGAMAAAVGALEEAGFVYVVLHRRRAKSPDLAQALLDRAMGEPAFGLEGWIVWRVGSGLADQGR